MTTYGIEAHKPVIELNILKCNSLIILARDMIQDREWALTECGSYCFCVPDIRYTSLEEERNTLLKQIPVLIPDHIRIYTENRIKDVYANWANIGADSWN